MYVANAGASLFTYLPPAFALWTDHGHTVGFPQKPVILQVFHR